MYLNKITLSLILKPIFLKITIKYNFLETISLSFQKVLIFIFILKTKSFLKWCQTIIVLFFSFAFRTTFFGIMEFHEAKTIKFLNKQYKCKRSLKCCQSFGIFSSSYKCDFDYKSFPRIKTLLKYYLNSLRSNS